MFDLVDCEALLSAVELGFETWSANHRFIQFHDMSRDCAGTAPAVVPAGSGADVPAEEYAAECRRRSAWYKHNKLLVPHGDESRQAEVAKKWRQ